MELAGKISVTKKSATINYKHTKNQKFKEFITRLGVSSKQDRYHNKISMAELAGKIRVAKKECHNEKEAHQELEI